MECSQFSILSDWMQSSPLVQTLFAKSPMLGQYQRLPDGIKDQVKCLGTSTRNAATT